MGSLGSAIGGKAGNSLGLFTGFLKQKLGSDLLGRILASAPDLTKLGK